MSRIDPRLAALAKAPLKATTLRPVVSAIAIEVAEAAPRRVAPAPIQPSAQAPARASDAEALPEPKNLVEAPAPVARKPQTAKPAPGEDDRRDNGRKSQLVPAAVTWSDLRQPPLSCVIKDMSMTGVRIQLPPKKLGVIGGTSDVPNHFTLILRNEQLQYECEAAWRNGTQIGARFRGPSRPLEAKYKSKRGY